MPSIPSNERNGNRRRTLLHLPQNHPIQKTRPLLHRRIRIPPCRHRTQRRDDSKDGIRLFGRQLEVIQFRKGDVIAPNFIFANPNVMPITIETESEVNILRMSSRSLQQLVDSFSTIRWNFIGILSNIGAYLASKMKFISLLTIKEKVRFYLHTEALVQHSKTIVLAQSRQHLADSFAIQKFSLIRCLAELAEDGAISINGKEITILDIRKLQI